MRCSDRVTQAVGEREKGSVLLLLDFFHDGRKACQYGAAKQV